MEYYPPGGLVSATNNPSQDPLQTPATTGGSSTAYTLTDTRIGTPADGQVFAFIPHTNSGPSPTLSVNGGSARPIRYPDATLTSFRDIATAQLIPQQAYMVRLVTGSGIYQVLSKLSLTTSDMPRKDCFYATRATNQTGMTAANVDNTILWDSPSKNDNSRWTYNSGTGIATCAVAGRYISRAQLYQTTVTTSSSAKIKKGSNNVAQSFPTGGATEAVLQAITPTLDYSVGDTLSCTLAASGTPALGASLSWWEITYEGASS